MPSVSIVVPVFRNAETLAELHRRIRAAVPASEILFVDDGSDDGSAAVIRSIDDADVRLITLPKNGGQQQAVLAGLREASGDVIATLDADLQDAPEALPALVALLSDADAAFAARRGAKSTSRIFKRLMHRLTGLPAGAGMFLAMRRETLRAILEAPPSPFYLPTAIMGVTRRVATIPVARAPRGGGVSQYTFLRRARLALGAIVGVLHRR